MDMLPPRLIDLHRWINRRADRHLLYALLALVATTLLSLNFLDLPFSIPRLKALSGGLGILDLKLFYQADTAYRHIEAYGPEGRRLYALGLLSVDLIMPMLLSMLLAVALTLTFRRRPFGDDSRWNFLNLLPLLPMSFDYLENSAILTMLWTFPQDSYLTGTLAGIFTFCKQLTTMLCLFMLMVGNVSAWLSSKRGGAS